jgi:hypothetical protein
MNLIESPTVNVVQLELLVSQKIWSRLMVIGCWMSEFLCSNGANLTVNVKEKMCINIRVCIPFPCF